MIAFVCVHGVQVDSCFVTGLSVENGATLKESFDIHAEAEYAKTHLDSGTGRADRHQARSVSTAQLSILVPRPSLHPLPSCSRGVRCWG